jgi:hypothetical protein
MTRFALTLTVASMLLYDPWAGAVAIQVGFLVAVNLS